jgi:hypothetical protein
VLRFDRRRLVVDAASIVGVSVFVVLILAHGTSSNVQSVARQPALAPDPSCVAPLTVHVSTQKDMPARVDGSTGQFTPDEIKLFREQALVLRNEGRCPLHDILLEVTFPEPIRGRSQPDQRPGSAQIEFRCADLDWRKKGHVEFRGVPLPARTWMLSASELVPSSNETVVHFFTLPVTAAYPAGMPPSAVREESNSAGYCILGSYVAFTNAGFEKRSIAIALEYDRANRTGVSGPPLGNAEAADCVQISGLGFAADPRTGERGGIVLRTGTTSPSVTTIYAEPPAGR